MATGRVPTTANSPLTAKGDLFTYSTAPARLAVGSNGDTIVADSSTSTGLRYQGSAPAGKNGIINSAFEVWQRGTSLSSTAAYNNYTADRYPFNFGLNTNATISRQATNDTTNLPFIQYCARNQRNSGATTVATMALNYTMENSDSARFIGQTVTFSFYARAGANYSSASNALSVAVATGTGTDQSIASGLTGQANFITQTATLTTTWQRFTYTGTVPTSAKQVGFFLYYVTSGTAGAADFFEITGFQLELGSVATAFARNSGTIQGETSACQRYYFRTQTGTNAGYFGVTVAGSATTTYANVIMKQTMRSTVTAIDFSGLRWQAITSSGNITNATISDATPENVVLNCTTTGATAGVMNFFAGQSNTAYVGFSAEL